MTTSLEKDGFASIRTYLSEMKTRELKEDIPKNVN
jgi:hypothetical protein